MNNCLGGTDELLTREEEAGLAMFVEDGGEDGDYARKWFVLKNQRLVASIAKKFANRGLPLDDLISEGNIGLIKAIGRFDWRMGNKFSTYAVWWIRQAIDRALARSGNMTKLPAHAFLVHIQIKQAINDYDKAISDTEVADIVGCSVEEVEIHRRVMGSPLSICGEGEGDLVDWALPDEGDDMDRLLELSIIRQRVTEALEGVRSERIREIIRSRYTLDDQPYRTLRQIGADLKMSGENVRLLEREGMAQLQSELEDLIDFI